MTSSGQSLDWNQIKWLLRRNPEKAINISVVEDPTGLIPYIPKFIVQLDTEKEYLTTHLIRNNLEDSVFQELWFKQQASIMWKDNQYYFCKPVNGEVTLYFGEFTIISKAGQGSPTILIGNSVCANPSEISEKLFGSSDYEKRGYAMEWANSVAYDFKEEEHPKKCRYNIDDFIGCSMAKNRMNKPYTIFQHKVLGTIYGSKDMVNKIEGITREQARSVYKKFDRRPPSNLYQLISAEKPQRTRRREPPVKEHDEFNLSYYIDTYHIKKHRRSLLITLNQDDIILKNKKELLNQLRKEGEVITQTESDKIWDNIMGKDV